MNTFIILIADIQSTIYQEAVSIAVVPGIEGDFGILPSHHSMLTTMRSGTIRIYQNEALIKSIKVNGGFVRVDKTACTILIS